MYLNTYGCENLNEKEETNGNIRSSIKESEKKKILGNINNIQYEREILKTELSESEKIKGKDVVVKNNSGKNIDKKLTSTITYSRPSLTTKTDKVSDKKMVKVLKEIDKPDKPLSDIKTTSNRQLNIVKDFKKFNTEGKIKIDSNMINKTSDKKFGK